MMSLGWVCCGRVQYLPEDIEQCTIFVDILHNDQNSPDIKKGNNYFKQLQVQAVALIRDLTRDGVGSLG